MQQNRTQIQTIIGITEYMPFHILTHNLTQGPKKRKNYMEEKGNTSPQKLQQHQEQTLDFPEAPKCWLSRATHSFSDKQTNKSAKIHT